MGRAIAEVDLIDVDRPSTPNELVAGVREEDDGHGDVRRHESFDVKLVDKVREAIEEDDEGEDYSQCGPAGAAYRLCRARRGTAGTRSEG